MTQDKQDIDKVNQILNSTLSANDLDSLFNYIENEKEFTIQQTQNQIKTSVVLEKVFNYFIINKLNFEAQKKKLWKTLYISAFKNEIWYENILFYLLNFYIKDNKLPIKL